MAADGAIYEDGFFGSFVLNENSGRYEVKAPWLGDTVTLKIDPEGSELALLIAQSKDLWAAQVAWDEKLRQHATEKLLDLWNEDWRQEDEEELSEADFSANLQLSSIWVSAEELTFWFLDNDI